MSEETDAKTRRRILDHLVMENFVPGLEARHDQFAITRKVAERYSDGCEKAAGSTISVADILERLGPGWTAREDHSDTETVFRREIDAARAIDQIKARLSADR